MSRQGLYRGLDLPHSLPLNIPNSAQADTHGAQYLVPPTKHCVTLNLHPPPQLQTTTAALGIQEAVTQPWGVCNTTQPSISQSWDLCNPVKEEEIRFSSQG